MFNVKDNVAFIEYHPRNFLDQFIVAVAPIIYSPFFLLIQCNKAENAGLKNDILHLFKVAVEMSIHNIPILYREHKQRIRRNGGG